MAALLNQ